MTSTPKEATSRRDFLKLAGTAAPAAAVAVAAGGAEAQAADADVKADCLQDTAHARAYYSSARF
ncbi:twin-arginine translocation signal domain-containing protein [Tropicimonas isoalkanivorans]|uniref:Formate dehydrogenase region TAT target n=1 Tax=Tropicimonas isoalkanivorans TaxID=441112 RepID=A0A1I1DGZ5_9RHOB|nr:twin-arginine translocation signal domain-containing protein [Tropicimonas isoalkanivorans]SFB72030.1 formate dehydrogenase region TAT target [Tropicimonas isoalkanivorans]